MSARNVVEIDLARVDELIGREEQAFADKQPRSIAYQQEASRRLPGAVSSSWQTAPPHPIYVSRGKGTKVWDLDGNEFVDYHNGYGVMVTGHAHPKIVEAVQRQVELGTHFAQPTEDALGCNCRHGDAPLPLAMTEQWPVTFLRRERLLFIWCYAGQQVFEKGLEL